jgi:hypothetical protein
MGVGVEKGRQGDHFLSGDGGFGDEGGRDIPHCSDCAPIEGDIDVREEAILVVEGEGGDILDQGTHCFTSKKN